MSDAEDRCAALEKELEETKKKLAEVEAQLKPKRGFKPCAEVVFIPKEDLPPADIF